MWDEVRQAEFAGNSYADLNDIPEQTGPIKRNGKARRNMRKAMGRYGLSTI